MRFSVFNVDYPWYLKTFSERGNNRAPKYPVMTKERGMNMPMQDVMAKDCYVFMWTSGPFVKQAFEICEAWGLEYSTYPFVWIKPTRRTASQGKFFFQIEDDENWEKGNGYVTMANAEIVLGFKRGRPERINSGVRQLIIEPKLEQVRSRNTGKPQGQLGTGVRQLIVHPRMEHSRKPDAAHQRIEQLYQGPYCELFARRPYPGWVCVGNQLTKRDIYDDLRLLAEAE